MRTTPGAAKERVFSVADGLVVIGALGVGLAMVRGWWEPRWCNYAVGFFPGQHTLSLARRIHYDTSVGVSWTIPFAMTLTVAWLILRLRSPRPTSRRMARQPGAVACASALAAIAFRVGQDVFCWVLGYLTRPQSLVRLPSPPFLRHDNLGFHPTAEKWLRDVFLEGFPFLISPSVAVAIVVAWSVLKASGRWRADPGWIDRSGRWLGVYWVALGLVLATLEELWKFVI